jgi:hypothetical protein
MLDFQLDDGPTAPWSADAPTWHAAGNPDLARRPRLQGWLLCSVALLGPVFILAVTGW